MYIENYTTTVWGLGSSLPSILQPQGHDSNSTRWGLCHYGKKSAVFTLRPTVTQNWHLLGARSYMFSVHDPGKMFSKQPSSRYTSVHIASTVKCSRYPFVQILNGHTSRSAQYDLLCIHCATCEVISVCTLCADSGLRAKPRPLRTLFLVAQRSYLFGCVLRGRFVPRTWFDRVPDFLELF